MMQWILSFFVLLFSATFASADLTAEFDAITETRRTEGCQAPEANQ